MQSLAPCNCIPMKDTLARWLTGGWFHNREECKLIVGEPAAYQASWHRFRVGKDSARRLSNKLYKVCARMAALRTTASLSLICRPARRLTGGWLHKLWSDAKNGRCADAAAISHDLTKPHGDETWRDAHLTCTTQ